MNGKSPKIHLHERPSVQLVVSISIILAGIAAVFELLDHFKITSERILPPSQRAFSFCVEHWRWLVAVLLLVSALIYRRLVARFFRWIVSSLSGAYVKVLAFLLDPLFPQEKPEICYSQPVVFQHFTTGKYLTSIDGIYYTHPKGSGQQIVFGASLPDENSIWWIESAHGIDPKSCTGRDVAPATVIRIYHPASDQFLHSHADESPCSVPGNVQREVSVSSQNNVQDNWTITASGQILIGEKLRFEHSDPNQILHSHDRAFQVTGRASCFEITCSSARNEDDIWILRRSNLIGLKAPKVPQNPGLVIYWASYGNGRTYHNVTAILRSEVRGGTLSITANADRVGSHLVGDPIPGTPKQLSAHYSFRGVRMHKAQNEGHALNLP